MLQTLPKVQMVKNNSTDFAVIILLFQNPAFKGFSRPFDLDIAGKKMWKFVELACSGFAIKTTVCNPETDILALIKPMLSDAKYTMVFFSDTPLLQKSTVAEIADFAQMRQINVLKLPRGYVFDTQYIKSVTSITNSHTEYFGDEDFTQVFDLRQLEFVANIMKNRILEYHQKNGVYIKDNNSTFIDVDVVIESGVVIEPHNVLKGRTIISKNTTLLPNNVLDSSVVGSGCTLKGAFIANAKIPSGTTVEAFEKIEG